MQVGPTRLVRSVPGELSTDGNSVLALAQGAGHVSQEQVCQVLACLPALQSHTNWQLSCSPAGKTACTQR